MSASLVGSEMCIRDRLSSEAHQVSTSSRWRGWSVRQQASECPSTRSAVAVSYTHLTLPTICSV
eukprot:10113496-Alexandrium_andersonii.AAC.1